MGKKDFGHREKKKVKKGAHKPLILSEFEPEAGVEVVRKRKAKEQE